MVVTRLSIYDFIVDLIPGFSLLMFLIPMVPSGGLQIRIPGTVLFFILIILGYISGRMIHAISGILSYIPGVSVDTLIPIVNIGDEEDDIVMDEDRQEYMLAWLHGSSEDTPRYNIYENLEPKEFAERLVYAQDSLYSRYNIMSTFYRNLSLVFFIVILVYIMDIFINVRYRTVWDELTGGNDLWIAIPALVVLLFLSVTRMFVFTIRARSSLIDDAHIYMNTELKE